MGIVKKIYRLLCLLIAVIIVLGIVGYGLFGVKIMDVKEEAEVIHNTKLTVTLKRQLNDDMYAIVFVEAPPFGWDNRDFMENYMKYSSSSSYTLYRNDEIIATDESDGLNVEYEVSMYDKGMRVIEDVIYYDEEDEEHWFSYRMSTRITFEGENEKYKGTITETKLTTPKFISQIKLSNMKYGTLRYDLNK